VYCYEWCTVGFESIYKQLCIRFLKKPGGARKLKFGIKLSNALGKLGIDVRKETFC
jgi:long-chain acyl-CoA synthetase